MGALLQAECAKCGYAEDASLGAGMLYFETSCEVPASCSHCERVVTVEWLQPRPSCPTCRSEIVFYGQIAGSTRALGATHWSLPDGSLIEVSVDPCACPKCGEPALTFSMVGCFD